MLRRISPRDSGAIHPLIALVTGALSALAFAPADGWPLMLFAFAFLFSILKRAETLKQALLVGWLFGLGQFLVGLNWIATAFTYQSAMPAWLGWVAVVLLSLYLAVYPALAAGVAWRIGKGHPLAFVLTLAGAWAVTEWLRAGLFTGFAWNPVGVTLADTPWLKVSTFIGTYGLSMLAVLTGGALWLAYRQRWWSAFGIGAALCLSLTLPAPLVPDSCCLRTFELTGQGHRIDATGVPDAGTSAVTPSPAPSAAPQAAPRPPAASAAQAPLPPAPPPVASPPEPKPMTPEQQMQYLLTHRVFYSVRVVQPNIGQQDKWRPGFSDEAARRLARLSTQSDPREPRLLLWPEAAVTEPLLDERGNPYSAFADFERRRAAAVLRPGEYLLTGGISLFSPDQRRVSGAANSVYVLGEGGRVVGRYDKAHLVPYGEYLPMRPLLSALGLSRLAPGDVDFVPGPGPRTLTVPGWGKVGFQICYEIIFSGEVVDRGNRPHFIFNPSNDAWFGAWGPPQHLAQARLRAAEEGLPVIRSTPTGISAVIDARGRVAKALPWQSAGVIDSDIPVEALQPTVFARFGNLIPLALGFALIIAGIVLARGRRYRRMT